MTDRLELPWQVEDIDADGVARLAACHVADPKAVELTADIEATRNMKMTKGRTGLSDARSVSDVVPGSAVVLGSYIGRYLANLAARDFGDDIDPIVTLELLPIRPSEVARLLGRNRGAAS